MQYFWGRYIFDKLLSFYCATTKLFMNVTPLVSSSFDLSLHGLVLTQKVDKLYSVKFNKSHFVYFFPQISWAHSINSLLFLPQQWITADSHAWSPGLTVHTRCGPAAGSQVLGQCPFPECRVPQNLTRTRHWIRSSWAAFTQPASIPCRGCQRCRVGSWLERFPEWWGCKKLSPRTTKLQLTMRKTWESLRPTQTIGLQNSR